MFSTPGLGSSWETCDFPLPGGLALLGSSRGAGRIEGRVLRGAGRGKFPPQVTSITPLAGAGQRGSEREMSLRVF